jgi:hypothetical protein
MLQKKGQGSTKNPKIFCTVVKSLIQYNQNKKLHNHVPK